MKKNILLLSISILCMHSFGATITITNSGNTFTPPTVTIKSGDNIVFDISSSHDAVQVSKSTWDANGNTPLSGGFSVNYGGGTVQASQLPVGTHYYVCTPHAFMGMKGTIIVEEATSTDDIVETTVMSVYPNPVKGNINIRFNAVQPQQLELKLYDLQGKLVEVLLPGMRVTGLFEHSFPTTGFNPGVYLLAWVTDGKANFKRIVILKD